MELTYRGADSGSDIRETSSSPLSRDDIVIEVAESQPAVAVPSTLQDTTHHTYNSDKQHNPLGTSSASRSNTSPSALQPWPLQPSPQDLPSLDGPSTLSLTLPILSHRGDQEGSPSSGPLLVSPRGRYTNADSLENASTFTGAIRQERSLTPDTTSYQPLPPLSCAFSEPQDLVTINLSDSLPEPPAYVDEDAPQSSSTVSDRTNSASFNGSIDPRHISWLQQDGSGVQQTGPLPTLPSVLSPSFRHSFLEEDELPGYAPVFEVNLHFRLPEDTATTYIVIPSQGPAEFRDPRPQPDRAMDIYSDNQHNSRTRPQSGAGVSAVDADIIRRRESIGEPGQRLDGVGQVAPTQLQPGAWTLEYWVEDAIEYLCYLMDPKLSGTTELVPRTMTTNRTARQIQSTNLAPAPLETTTNDISTTTTRSAPAAAQGQPSPSSYQESRQSIGPSEGRTTAVETAAGVNSGSIQGMIELSTMASCQSRMPPISGEHAMTNMERVPTGHIRGRPPPLNRIRNTLLAPLSPHAIENLESLHSVGRRRVGPTPLTLIGGGSLSRTRPPEEAIANSTAHATPAGAANNSAVSPPSGNEAFVATVEAAPEVEVATSSIGVEPTAVTTDEERPITPARISQESPFGTLPSVQHVQINDGYEGEEADATLADAVAMETAEGRLSTQTRLGNVFSHALSSEFFKSPTYAFVSADDPQTWIWWSTHHETNLQRCRQEGPYEKVMMWWRTRADYYSKEGKAKRRKERQKKMEMRRQLPQHQREESIGIKDRWHRWLSLRSSTPHNESMEITMRVRGLYYAWREEAYEPQPQELPVVPVASRMRDLQEAGPEGVVEVGVAEGTQAVAPSLSGPATATTLSMPASPDYEDVIGATKKPRMFLLVRDDSLVMGQRVKGGTVAEVYIIEDGVNTAAVSQDNVAISNYDSIAAVSSPLNASFSLASALPPSSSHARPSISSSSTSSGISEARSSSFPSSLRRRRCVVRILHGMHSEIETFALSTGPRLPELFELYTDQSIPGPSRGSFICSLVTFGTIFIVAFISIAFAR
ncbi:hypothetical protein BC939DRAFT_444599 [Gamsiella multidivaricata]|uniref:uncharacterized protein n=1 Tax=Gamsiella multidivaricata TaxID=101098 RepID=UPI002220B198|nr:uncharacterized protein BC939DRAFT_444599 [Gamsiella multidivaricata]KAG0364298.1 hypothetical protein BGZ54_007664 [Gamsiella multidivaricata]KAI7827541.1 hypothetical protein BC939DRAFT_444599 [Gamsiella multidivaricata]